MITILEILCLILCVMIILAFIAYSITTSKIIKGQEKEIASLKTALKRERQREKVQIVYDGKKPKFGDF